MHLTTKTLDLEESWTPIATLPRSIVLALPHPRVPMATMSYSPSSASFDIAVEIFSEPTTFDSSQATPSSISVDLA